MHFIKEILPSCLYISFSGKPVSPTLDHIEQNMTKRRREGSPPSTVPTSPPSPASDSPPPTSDPTRERFVSFLYRILDFLWSNPKVDLQVDFTSMDDLLERFCAHLKGKRVRSEEDATGDRPLDERLLPLATSIAQEFYMKMKDVECMLSIYLVSPADLEAKLDDEYYLQGLRDDDATPGFHPRMHMLMVFFYLWPDLFQSIEWFEDHDPPIETPVELWELIERVDFDLYLQSQNNFGVPDPTSESTFVDALTAIMKNAHTAHDVKETFDKEASTLAASETYKKVSACLHGILPEMRRFFDGLVKEIVDECGFILPYSVD